MEQKINFKSQTCVSKNECALQTNDFLIGKENGKIQPKFTQKSMMLTCAGNILIFNVSMMCTFNGR